MLRPVMAPTAFRWPRFSATRISATGAISTIALASKTGAVKAGAPNQAALAISAPLIGLPQPSPLASTA